MSMAHRRREAAFTRRDLAVVIAVVAVLVLSLVYPNSRATVTRGRRQLLRISCCANLKQIGTAYRIWANDHGDQFPAFTTETNGGWRDLLCLTNASAYCWTNYVSMANELGQSPLTLICPADERRPASSFSNHLANTNISYFVGANANAAYPQSLLGGDRNLGPGTTPDSEYGYSPANGQGNDVIINGPVCWSQKTHFPIDSVGAGNLLLGDGSVQQVTSRTLYGTWVKNALAEKAAHDKATNLAGMRMIFP